LCARGLARKPKLIRDLSNKQPRSRTHRDFVPPLYQKALVTLGAFDHSFEQRRVLRMVYIGVNRGENDHVIGRFGCLGDERHNSIQFISRIRAPLPLRLPNGARGKVGGFVRQGQEFRICARGVSISDKSALGQKRTYAAQKVMSALPPKATSNASYGM